MKTTTYIIAAVIAFASFGATAQTQNFDVTKSTVQWLGKKIGGQHEGNIKLTKGFFEIKNEQISAGEFSIDMNSITCTDLKDEAYNQKLVGHLKSDDFFGVEKFPVATFKIVKAAAFTKGKATVTGEITIKGKTESISFDLVKNEDSYTASIDIDRSKFDVKFGSSSFFDNLGDKTINDIFNLQIKLIAK